MTDFETAVIDAKNDLSQGWVPKNYTLDYIISELRLVAGASDSYIAGYISVLFV